MEHWRPIPQTKGFIEVSDQGRVRSLLSGTPRILKVQSDKKGYLRLRVTIEREKMCFKVHREVAKAFIPNINNLPQVNHKDGNKNNNCIDNLEWCTNRQNQLHALALGLFGEQDKVHDPLSVEDVNYIPKRTKKDGVTHYNSIGRTRYGGYRLWNNPNPPKPVIGYSEEEVKIFKSVSEAEVYIGSRHISDVLKGKRHQVKGWTFSYYEKGGDSNSYSIHTEAK